MPRQTKCSVTDCFRKSSDPEKLTFHRFPSDVDLCRKWLRIAGVKELTWLPEAFLTKSRHICSVHFPPSSYRPGTNFLKCGSVPTVFERPVMPLTEEEVMVYPLKSKSPAKRKKKDTVLNNNESQFEEVSTVNQGGAGTSEVVCNSPTFVEYLNTGTEDSSHGDLTDVLDSPEMIHEEKFCPDLLGDVAEDESKDEGNQETLILPDPLQYSFTLTENLDIRLDVTKKPVEPELEPEIPQDLEYWKNCAERLKKENEMLTAKVDSMQLVIDSLQKEVETRRNLSSVNLGMAGNQCYFIDLSSAMAPISS